MKNFTEIYSEENISIVERSKDLLIPGLQSQNICNKPL